ncbi:DUF4870 domain-containing protein [Aquibacillus kalidii]|uniref:DUF4870 domain-containing protein n=1 Tax=Aquibacillus kalidii TaxID=2762597 RepID=UPI0016456BE5|nr:DUF4870 domain-containing protein [Aquibacillus kalidii]
MNVIHNSELEEKVLLKKTGKIKTISAIHYLLAFIPIPPINIGLTFIVWLLGKDKSAFIDHHGRQSLNCQISFQLYGLIISIMTYIINLFVELDIRQIGYSVFVIVALYYMVAIIVAIVSSFIGKKFYFPLVIPFFRVEKRKKKNM